VQSAPATTEEKKAFLKDNCPAALNAAKESYANNIFT